MRSPIRTWSLRSRLVLGVVILTAIGYVLSGIVAQSALKSYLLQEVDAQLVSISGGTLPRVAEAGIANDRDDYPHIDGHHPKPDASTKPQSPLQRIPTSTSVTLLDSTGTVTAELGGDLNASSVSDYLVGLTPAKAAKYKGLPFTIKTKGTDFRAIALVLPNDQGTVIAAQSLNELDKTIGKLGFFFLLIGLLLVTLVAIASRIVIKIGMQPLEDVEITAEQIAAGDLSARMP
ncbi:MAG: hypothetical protein RLZ23_1187, partial [Actinomycetota bacterium]